MLISEYTIIPSCCYCHEKIISFIKNICEIINLNISSIESYVGIFCELTTVALLLWGCIIVKKIKDKKVDATTDFYSKLKVHLVHLKYQLGTEEFTVLNYLYDSSIQQQLQKPEDCESFLNVVNCMLSFLKCSDNQVLPSGDFFTNLNKLVEKLSSYTLLPDYHPFSDLGKHEVKNELNELQNIITALISEIEREQQELFKNIWNHTS